jgi:dihydrofolate reductase
MVSSLDGFIAKKDNSIGWFETADRYEKGVSVTPEEAAAFLKTIDCYVMGSRTYELALELSKTYGWAYGDVPTVVLTRRNLPVDRSNIQFYAGDLHQLVHEVLQPNYHHVWLAGGAELATDFIRLNLADEIRLSILPVLLGGGVPFFNGINQEKLLHLIDVTAYKNGMVELRYEFKK